jgi:hypothetical protein
VLISVFVHQVTVTSIQDSMVRRSHVTVAHIESLECSLKVRGEFHWTLDLTLLFSNVVPKRLCDLGRPP